MNLREVLHFGSQIDITEAPGEPNITQLLQGMQPDRPLSTKVRAATELGQLDTSSREIVEALLAAKQSEPAYKVRKAAAKALQAPVHQALLDQHPDLLERANVGVPPPAITPGSIQSPGQPARSEALALHYKAIRDAGKRKMISGAVVCIVGIIVTVATYTLAASAGGGTYIIAWGAIIFGAIQVFRGLAQYKS